ncbi:hypothetical protein [Pseudomonas sp.]|uniref:hypothetical protein n=1 Tax=Pseudomonas sp. TaxID=306 RepID=UPI002EDA66C9
MASPDDMHPHGPSDGYLMSSDNRPDAGLFGQLKYDANFGDSGRLYLPFKGQEGWASCVIQCTSANNATQYLATYFEKSNKQDPDHQPIGCLARFGADGILDKTFGTDQSGVVDVPFTDTGTSVLLGIHAPDDLSLITLWGHSVESKGSAAYITRWTNDGNPHSDFAPLNISKLLNITSQFGKGNACLVQADGSIYAVLDTVEGDMTEGYLIKITPDGTLDTAFADAGILRIRHPISPGISIALSSISQDKLGNIYACGYAAQLTEKSTGILIKVLPSGNLDQHFGDQGIVELNRTPEERAYYLGSIYVDDIKDNKIVLVGSCLNRGVFRGMVTVLQLDGSPDTTFNGGVPVFHQFYDGANDAWYMARYEVGVEPERKILISGGFTAGPVLGRFRDDGSVDASLAGATFGTLYNVKFYPNNGLSFVQPKSGQILIAGNSAGKLPTIHALHC